MNIKTIKDTKNAQHVLNMIKITGKPYKITHSNYTTKIEGELNYHFIEKEQSNKVFIAYNKIKKDLKEWSANEMPDIKMQDLIYFSANKFTKNIFLPEVYNIDLKSAYATILFNDYFISPKTFQFINSLDKMDRLACVGMLASKKNVFHFNERSELIKVETIKSETENYFYYCVMRTHQIIEQCKKIAKESYLFSWVDGIYLDNEFLAFSIEEYLKGLNYKCSFEALKNFSVQQSKRYSFIQFSKDGKIKEYSIPKNNGTFAKDILKSINLNLI